MDKRLPPLPGSDGDTLHSNRSARDFWKENEVIKIDEPTMKKCDHSFMQVVNGVQCKKCNFGLIGVLEIREGKLFHQDTLIKI